MKIRAWKENIFDIVSKDDGDNRASRVFDLLIMGLIVLSVVTIVLESFDDLNTRYRALFSAFESFTVAIFTVEYALRIWTADLLYPNEKHPRLKYVFSFLAIIDLMAILPFYLPFLSADFRFLRMVRLLRLFRLFRVFKMGRYLEALQTVMQVIRASASRLVIAVVLCFFVMLFSAIIMYTVENPVQPEQFPNVIASLWWAICTLTTVGYGDVYPITAVGRFFAALISLVGIGIIAIPTGIIAAGFTTAIDQRNDTRAADDPKPYCPYCGHRIQD
ncbi:MAG: ion transporter [Clostridia bacterium]|nr:ion transporter [Clostridia bacterium]